MILSLELGDLGPESAAKTSGNFFEALTNSEFYKNTKVVLLTLFSVNLCHIPVAITFQHFWHESH